MTRRTIAATLCLTALLALTGTTTVQAVEPSTHPAATAPAPTLADPSATGARLAERFLGLLKARDVAGLKRFLGDNFQLQRADGSGASKADYLTSLPTITEFVVTDPVGAQSGDTLAVRYLANVEGIINGKAYSAGPAPRLSTFRWDGTRWQLISHANFNPLKGAAS